MSHPFSNSAARRRAAGILSAGAVVVGLIAAAPVATAADSGGDASAVPVAGTHFTAGRYLVMLRAPGAAGYGGGNARYAATHSSSGEFDAHTDRAQAYTNHLRSTHRSIAQEYGTKPVADFTVASNGFVADLTKSQAIGLAADSRVLLVEKSRNYKLDSINTADTLGMTGKHGAWRMHGGEANAGSGVVVGDLDSGIWPESKSFRGATLTTKPQTKWDISQSGTATRMEKADGTVFRGECQPGDGWDETTCNTKIISARYYGDSFLSTVPAEDLADTEQISARDGGGHGTHTASTAAGEKVTKVTTEGRKFGTVVGMAPAAKLAVYKVCWEAADPEASGCNNADIVAAVDQAVLDGVDVINFSVGGGANPNLDSIEVAFEGAAEAGVFVSASAGNSGPGASTLDHPSPWLTTVAASTYTNFENTLVLGDGTKIVGASISQQAVPSSPLVDAAASGVAGADPDALSLCGPDTLDPAAVEGAIVVCARGVYDRVAKSAEVARAGGIAMVLANLSPNSLDSDFHAVPTIHISDTDAPTVYDYVESAGADATASFKIGNLTSHVTPLPQVAGFSSRGPILVSGGDMLKPDISAPGVSVLAAVAPPSNSDRDYDLYSGTSMAAPHITGLAAFMQGVHPRWTPMQIKSAMMTTATPTKDAEGKPSTDALAQGAGEVTPTKFFSPGLFVESTVAQWRGFLTEQGIDTGTPSLDPKQVNTPSLADGSVTGETSFTRTFRATRKGTWTIKPQVPGFQVTATPKVVHSTRHNDLVDVTFHFVRNTADLGSYVGGSITLQGPTTVRLPVALQSLSVDAPGTVTGTGTSGSADVDLTAGFTGDLAITTHGMAKSDTKQDAVEAGDYNLECVTVADGSTLAKFQVDATDDDADLDMYVYSSDSCDPNDITAQVGVSGTASGDEAVTLRDPAPGAYLVEIDGFSAGAESGSPIPYTFDSWDINPTTTAGSLTVAPNPVAVTQNQATTVTASWSGLDADAHYLGYLEYPDTDQVTLVDVTTGP